MAIKVGFYGASCYDLINYLSRTLYHMNLKNILMVDLSREKSLACSIPLFSLADGNSITDDIIDYRGISFSTSSNIDDEDSFDVILYYFGFSTVESIEVDYGFVVSNSEIHCIERIKMIDSDVIFTNPSTDSDNKKHDLFKAGKLYLIPLGIGVAQRESFIAQQLNFDLYDTYTIELDENNMDARLFCQYDTVFKFNKISEEFKEVIMNICLSIKPDTSLKDYKKAAKIAERGK